MRLFNRNVAKGGTKEGDTWGPRFAVGQSLTYYPDFQTSTQITAEAKNWATMMDPRPEITEKVVRRELVGLVARGEVQVTRRGRGQERKYSRPFHPSQLNSGMEEGVDFG